MAQLSFGRTSGGNVDCGLLGPEFNKEVSKIVLESCGSFHRSKLQVGKLGYVHALGVLTREETFLKHGEFSWLGASFI